MPPTQFEGDALVGWMGCADSRWGSGGFGGCDWQVSRGAFEENGGWLQAGRKGSGGAFQRNVDVL